MAIVVVYSARLGCRSVGKRQCTEYGGGTHLDCDVQGIITGFQTVQQTEKDGDTSKLEEIEICVCACVCESPCKLLFIITLCYL